MMLVLIYTYIYETFCTHNSIKLKARYNEVIYVKWFYLTGM